MPDIEEDGNFYKVNPISIEQYKDFKNPENSINSFTASSLLQAWGWNLSSDDEAIRFNRTKSDKIIVVISHTSYWDFFILMMYRTADARIRENLYLVVKP